MSMGMARSVRRLEHRRWDIAWIVCICAVLAILLASELGHRELARGNEASVRSFRVGAHLHQLAARLAEAELGERVFLLTWNETYLERYRQAVSAVRRLLEELRAAYAARTDPAAELYAVLAASVGGRLDAMESALQGGEAWSQVRDLRALRDMDQREATDENLALIEHLAAQEASVVNDTAQGWRRMFDWSRFGITGGAMFSVALLALLFLALRNDRRCTQERQRLLDGLVRSRTRQLGMLASRLQEASEAQKAALARELHDELGALLTASKMDLAWVRRQLDPAQVRIAAKIEDVVNLLDQGLLAKRRIVEGLRPSALDHFGICVAARDLCEQIARRAGWRLELDLPQADPALDADGEIVLYRILQESLTNAVKYAQAKHVRVALKCEPACCKLEILDDGVGFSTHDVRPEAQGLFGMRHRVEARQGEFHVHSAPGAGARISVMLPSHSAATAPPARPATLPVKMELGSVQA